MQFIVTHVLPPMQFIGPEILSAGRLRFLSLAASDRSLCHTHRRRTEWHSHRACSMRPQNPAGTEFYPRYAMRIHGHGRGYSQCHERSRKTRERRGCHEGPRSRQERGRQSVRFSQEKREDRFPGPLQVGACLILRQRAERFCRRIRTLCRPAPALIICLSAIAVSVKIMCVADGLARLRRGRMGSGGNGPMRYGCIA